MWLCFVGGRCFNNWASLHACLGGKQKSFGLLLRFSGRPTKAAPFMRFRRYFHNVYAMFFQQCTQHEYTSCLLFVHCTSGV